MQKTIIERSAMVIAGLAIAAISLQFTFMMFHIAETLQWSSLAAFDKIRFGFNVGMGAFGSLMGAALAARGIDARTPVKIKR